MVLQQVLPLVNSWQLLVLIPVDLSVSQLLSVELSASNQHTDWSVVLVLSTGGALAHGVLLVRYSRGVRVRALGSAAPNGYTTVVQADRMARVLGLGPGRRLLDLEVGTIHRHHAPTIVGPAMFLTILPTDLGCVRDKDRRN